jgi:hypothetical protein
MEVLSDSFGNLTNLEHIDLSYSNLQMLPNSFGNLIRLKYLDLQHCSDLTISIETLGDINTLEHLYLSHCERIEVFPSQVTQQRYLKKIIFAGCSFKGISEHHWKPKGFGASGIRKPFSGNVVTFAQ